MPELSFVSSSQRVFVSLILWSSPEPTRSVSAIRVEARMIFGCPKRPFVPVDKSIILPKKGCKTSPKAKMGVRLRERFFGYNLVISL